MTRSVPPRAAFDNRAGYLIACLPFVVLGIVSVVTPTFLEPIFSNPPSLFGLPAGMILLGLGVVWGALAFPVIWATSTRIGVLVAQLFFTMPSLLMVILAAPLIRILDQLGQI